jgi:hypothetical protein
MLLSISSRACGEVSARPHAHTEGGRELSQQYLHAHVVEEEVLERLVGVLHDCLLEREREHQPWARGCER